MFFLAAERLSFIVWVLDNLIDPDDFTLCLKTWFCCTLKGGYWKRFLSQSSCSHNPSLEAQRLCLVSSSCKSATSNSPRSLSKPHFSDLPNPFFWQRGLMTLRWSCSIFTTGQLRGLLTSMFLGGWCQLLEACVLFDCWHAHVKTFYCHKSCSKTVTAGFFSPFALNLDAVFSNRVKIKYCFPGTQVICGDLVALLSIFLSIMLFIWDGVSIKCWKTGHSSKVFLARLTWTPCARNTQATFNVSCNQPQWNKKPLEP